MVLNLVRRLPERFEPMVCCIHEAGPIGEEIRKTGTRVDVLGLTPGLRRPFDVGRIRSYLARAQPPSCIRFCSPRACADAWPRFSRGFRS
jgi:hypothetical protein